MPMRQLRSCDFCGGDAAGIYEVLPADLSPTESEQRRVVLCDGCLETLETVIDPLLNRLRAEESERSVEKDTQRERSSSPNPTPASTESGEPGGIEGNGQSLDTSATAQTSAETPVGEDSSTTTDHSAAEAEPVSDKQPVDEEADDATEDTPSAAVETADAPASGDDTVGAADEGEQRESNADDEATNETDETPTETKENDSESTKSEPPNFRKVMRLLNNREFPVERTEFADLASGAYDLDPSQVDDIIEYAIHRDVLADDGGQLRRA
ncbi:hypothetical protein [Halogeometricum borinquense]|nr:hypothetical protein [Halogeometricum borinquense]